jgi:DNA-directed RNA polymerase specialized sigma24 family protein
MGKYVTCYCGNNNQALISLVDKLIEKNFGWLPQMYYDDFYSIASKVVWDCERQYEKSKKTQFKTFLTGCLTRKFKSQITYMNREKRKCRDCNGNLLLDISMNIVDEESGIEFGDTLVGSSDVFDSIGTAPEEFGVNMQKYLNSLTKQQKDIALLVSKGFTPSDIQKTLGISNERYQTQWNKMTTLRKTACLCEERK